MSGGVQADAGDEINLGAIARELWRKKLAIIAPTILIAAVAFAGVNLITPRYKSESRVLIESRENIFLRPEAEKSMTDRGSVDAETVTSQVQLVLSRDLAREVINELNLSELPEFNPALKEFSPLSILRKIGILRDPMSMSLEERVLAAYYERLQAFALDKSRVISIEFQSADPELAAKIANLVADKYLIFQQMAKQDQARSASKWLSGELGKLRDKVSEAEGKVEEFRAKSNLFVGTNNTSLSNQQLSDLNSQVSAARAQKADAEARARLIREALRTGATIESSDIVNSELIRRLSEQRVTLRAQLAEQSSTLLAQHPRIKEMRAQIADLDQQIRSEGERLARSLENEANVAGARLETLNAALEQLKGQAASTSDQDVQLRALEREAKAQRDLFESYLAKYREATARDSIAAAPADARVISRATVSNIPYFPKKTPIVLIAALGTFSLATAFVVAGALINGDPGRPSRVPVPAAPVPSVIVNVPPARSAAARTRATDASPAVAEVAPQPQPAPETRPDNAHPIAALAEELLAAGDEACRIAVVGSARDVGTTLSAIALGRILVRSARVVLVDLSFVSPNIDVISDDPSAPGIADLVHGTASFGDIITRDRGSRLHLVAAGQVGNDAHELFVSQMLWAAIDALAQSYDYLVLDVGSQSETVLDHVAACAPRAVLIGGATDSAALDTLAGELQAQGFAEVSILSGPPPELELAAVQSAA
ncbi:GumC family protein [Rhodoplanes sp. Z2-YC6860]|uniref:GumC family protein n=1 Tax=Rhodoplanes sp. Z2-YC6860 TaxID=674703 RepID=UPI00078DBD37|nr:exopolysaccharide transport family protein [Rhodoplanes sp. Z2-YC6860]AMN42256.1 succinoglycan transport protein [Rhodoplanes sp. Z2-YC6860]